MRTTTTRSGAMRPRVRAISAIDSFVLSTRSATANVLRSPARAIAPSARAADFSPTSSGNRSWWSKTTWRRSAARQQSGAGEQVGRVVQMQRRRPARELGERGEVQPRAGDRELERERGGAAGPAGGARKRRTCTPAIVSRARLAGVARGDHAHAMAGARERLGLAAHADVLRIGVVLEQHRDAMPLAARAHERPRRAPSTVS